MKISVGRVRNNLADVLNRVAYGGERIVLERRHKGVAALVSMEDLALLERMENAGWVREADRALAEMEAAGEKPMEWERAERDLDAARARRRDKQRRTA